MAEMTRGWSDGEVATLKDQINTQFETLAAKTDILDELEVAVENTWHGPDAEKYLDALFQYYNDLVEEVKKAQTGMIETIDNMVTQWTTFQG